MIVASSFPLGGICFSGQMIFYGALIFGKNATEWVGSLSLSCRLANYLTL